MAAIDGDVVPVVGPTTHTGDTDWTTVATVDAALFKVNNGKYLIKVVAKISGDDNANPDAEWRMAQGATPTEVVNSFMKLEVQSATATVASQYNYFTVFTQPATAEDLLFQIRTADSGATTRVDDLHVFWMRIDEAGTLTEDTGSGGDWKVATDLASPSDDHDGTMTSRLSLTWTPATADHDWLILGCGTTEIDTAGDFYELELFDSTGSAVLAFHTREGEDTGEIQMQTLIGRLLALPASSQTVQWRTRDTTGSGQTNNYLSCELFCLDLDVFEQHATDVSATLSQVDNDWIEANPGAAGSLNPDVSTAGDWFVIAGATAETNTAGGRTKHRIQIGGVTDPVGFGDDPRYSVMFDAADEQYTTVAAMPTFTTGVKDIDVDVQWQNNSGQSWAGMTAVAFSLELAAAPAADVYPPFKRKPNILVRI